MKDKSASLDTGFCHLRESYQPFANFPSLAKEEPQSLLELLCLQWLCGTAG